MEAVAQVCILVLAVFHTVVAEMVLFYMPGIAKGISRSQFWSLTLPLVPKVITWSSFVLATLGRSFEVPKDSLDFFSILGIVILN